MLSQLPLELNIIIISELLTDSTSYLNIKQLSKKYSRIADIAYQNQLKNSLKIILTLIHDLDHDSRQLTDDQEGIIGEYNKYPSIIKLQSTIFELFQNVLLSNNIKELHHFLINITNTLIDVIATLPRKVKLLVQSKYNHDIIKQGCTLKRGDIFLYPHAVQFYNINDVKLCLYQDLNLDDIIDDEIPCVDSWMTNRDNDNWNRHNYIDYLNEWIPLALFKNKKEGDTVQFKFDNQLIKITCKQNSYRYRGKNFDDLLINLVEAGIREVDFAYSCGYIGPNIEQKKNLLNSYLVT